jgi:siroheme synthase
MECEDPRLLAQWTARWEDLIEFEIIPVLTSAEAVAATAPGL